MRTILAAVEDIIFLSKIRQTAQTLGAPVEPVDLGNVRERAAELEPCAILIDLNHRSGRAVVTVKALKANPATASIKILGFVSHVQADLIKAAREAGCDWILARSAFSYELPQLLTKLLVSETC